MSINLKHIIISEKNQLAALYTEGILKELKTYSNKYNIGDIYIGKLERGLSNINAAFIKLDPIEKNGFIQVNNLIPGKFKNNSYFKLENFKFNESILVQIVKEPTGNKGPSLSTNIGLNGSYLILLPFGEGISVSKKLYKFTEKAYLRAFIHLLKPLNIGILIKKEASGINENLLKEDFFDLLNMWYKLQAKITTLSKPYLISNKVDFITNILTTFYDIKVRKISTDSLLGSWKIYKTLLSGPVKNESVQIKIEYYSNSEYFLNCLNLDFSIYSLLQSNLNLNTGGSIIIERTEALTAIDINSGSFNHLQTSRATLLWINCEAATEIARQLKLRNIGGIIVIDFIDMNYQKDQMKLLNHFNKVLLSDQGQSRIIQFSAIGLIELTRKRKGQSIYDIFSSKCVKCDGVGYKVQFVSIKPIQKHIKMYESYHTYTQDFIENTNKQQKN
jgi:ribonuclease E